MPELPEVEVVRRGLERHIVGGASIDSVDILHPRAIRRHLPGAADLAGQLTGERIASATVVESICGWSSNPARSLSWCISA